MNKLKYLQLRGRLYKQIGQLGNEALMTCIPELRTAYSDACLALDSIDSLGVRLGYLDPETNEEVGEG
jgi:hypothetical protein